ncbi:MAG: hypothetical protein HFI09_02900, partial [Bacilli bacterium]|nr:hypothetical protein [Bacilli bacterium]
MKNQNILHYDSENSYFYHLLLALIPLLLYGWYKNGILPFLNQDISWIKMFRPLYFPALVFSVSYLGDMVVAKIKKEKRANSLNPFYGLLLSMTLPINANIFIVSILVFFCFIFFSFWNRTKWKINTLLSTKVILFFILIANVSYFNATENINNLFYSLIDIFLGRNIGGLASTSIILMLGAYAFLSFDYYYKKSIPVYTFLTFTITALIIELITP